MLVNWLFDLLGINMKGTTQFHITGADIAKRDTSLCGDSCLATEQALNLLLDFGMVDREENPSEGPPNTIVLHEQLQFLLSSSFHSTLDNSLSP